MSKHSNTFLDSESVSRFRKQLRDGLDLLNAQRHKTFWEVLRTPLLTNKVEKCLFLLSSSCERRAVSLLRADQLPGPRRMTHTRGQKRRCVKRDCSSDRSERPSSCVTCKWDIIFFWINHSPSQNHRLRSSFVALSVTCNLFKSHPQVWYRHWTALLCFCQLWDSSSLLLVLSLISLHVILCTGFHARVLAAGRGLQGQEEIGAALWQTQPAPNRVHS